MYFIPLVIPVYYETDESEKLRDCGIEPELKYLQVKTSWFFLPVTSITKNDDGGSVFISGGTEFITPLEPERLMKEIQTFIKRTRVKTNQD